MFTLKLPRQSQIHRDFLIDLDGFQSFRKTAGFTVSVSKSVFKITAICNRHDNNL